MLVVLAVVPDVSGALPAKVLGRVDMLPWVAVAGGGLHSLVVCSDPSIGTADDEEVFGRPLGAALLPEALVALLHLLVGGGCEAVAVLLAHHGYGPVTLVEAITGCGLTVSQ